MCGCFNFQELFLISKKMIAPQRSKVQVSEHKFTVCCSSFLYDYFFVPQVLSVHGLTFRLQMMRSVGNNVIPYYTASVSLCFHLIPLLCFSLEPITFFPLHFLFPVELSTRSFLTHVFRVLILLLDSFLSGIPFLSSLSFSLSLSLSFSIPRR